MLRFEVLSPSGGGARGPRRGRLTLDHGSVETPAFMPVGTAGTVKAARWSDVEAAGAEIVLANTYHLMLRPGGDVVRRLGGLHRFIGWDRPLLTDSGGYQVMSLAGNRALSEEGVLFRSHIDGSAHALSPERAVDLQLGDFGVDVAMVLDECTPYPATEDAARASMELTHRWARRAAERRDALLGTAGALFGIVQGGMYPALRERSAAAIAALPFDGIACGGLSVGEPKEEMRAMVSHSRAISWASGARTTSSTPSRRASTSSIACFRRARRATASSTRPGARSRSGTRATARTARRPIPTAPVRPAEGTRGRICGISRWRESPPPRRS